ncbi:MAG TPA: hypothetical protein VKB49_24180, partial [Candidatus Sulfotelmatobacter sp.]|nr:hypothetical protein [Candidatus Sulfotelmatobacter sp.]
MSTEPVSAGVLQVVSADYPIGIRIGAVSISIESESNIDVALVPSLEPFRDEVAHPDIAVRVRRTSKLEQINRSADFESGSVWRLYNENNIFHFDFQSPVLGDFPYKRLVIDREFCRAELLLNGQCLPETGSVVPLDYPL